MAKLKKDEILTNLKKDRSSWERERAVRQATKVKSPAENKDWTKTLRPTPVPSFVKYRRKTKKRRFHRQDIGCFLLWILIVPILAIYLLKYCLELLS